MQRQNERTLKMKQEFMSLHEQGLSIKEIAARFNLNPVTVYAHLSAIALENGCTREDLLKEVHSPHLTHDRQFEPVAEVDVANYRRKFSKLQAGAKELSALMSDYIEKEEATE